MHLRYETGVATLVQFIIATAFSFLNGIVAIIGGCHGKSTTDCVSNSLLSLIVIILVVFYFGAVLALGYVAQERRSTNLARLLIAVELFTALVFLFDATHSPEILERITNFVSFLIAIWVIILAWRLSRAKGARIVKSRSRRRHSPRTS
jgi:preprotein translocase subunit SecG